VLGIAAPPTVIIRTVRVCGHRSLIVTLSAKERSLEITAAKRAYSLTAQAHGRITVQAQSRTHLAVTAGKQLHDGSE
jgi:hypothetical protein